MATGVDRRTVNVSGAGLRQELSSAAALTIGMIVEHAAAEGKIQVSSGAGDDYKGGTMIVQEAEERGKGLLDADGAVETYAIGEQVAVRTVIPGNRYLVLLTASQTITRGNELEVANTGKVVVAGGSNLAAFVALESLSPSQDALLLVEAL